jgi:KDO2-lipid IV(A) lauroyltransferase
MVSYILYLTGAALVRVFPRRIAKGIAAAIAFTFFVSRPAIRKNVRRNFQAMGIRVRSTFAVFYHFSHAVTDFLRLTFMAPDQLESICNLGGREHLDTALREGRGVILVAPHLGPWELAGAYLPAIGYRLNTVALEHPSRRVTQFFASVRRRWRLTDHPLHASAGELIRTLGRGELVVLLIDRNYSKRGLPLHLFGTEAILPAGHVVLSLRSGAPLVPCCCYYGADERIEIVVGERVATREGATESEIADACLARIEAFIRAHPDQWFAFDNIWPEESDV